MKCSDGTKPFFNMKEECLQGFKSSIFSIPIYKEWWSNINMNPSFITKEERLNLFGKLKAKVPMSRIVITEYNNVLEFHIIDSKVMYYHLYQVYENTE